jgi:2-polyprenyl-6-methoxyphenol hydroxylase-like FAD-dependent oxidoreductase
MEKTNVGIIDAVAIGYAAAYLLSKEGVKTLVVEQGEFAEVVYGRPCRLESTTFSVSFVLPV